MQREVSGPAYLDLVTKLLQRMRLASSEAGMWEAADLQWWWRKDQHHDPANARFWTDGGGDPIGAVIVTDWGGRWGCDVLAMPGSDRLLGDELWPHALRRIDELDPAPVEVGVDDDDTQAARVLSDAGFAIAGSAYMTCWMPAGSRAAPPELAAGYRLASAAERTGQPHHMIRRNGAHVAERLRECSLYRPELDLCIEAPDGTIAAYGLFWPDPVTGVGLVEPMRTEDAHQGRGLGRHLLRTGLQRLAAAGCTRLKVTYLEGNEPARLLYVNSGFEPRTRSHEHRREPAT